jgi:DNA topoisomerase-2
MSEVKKIEYKKLTLREHIRTRPGLYLLSGKLQTNTDYTIYDEEEEITMIKEDLEYVPAVYKAVDEIITNAIDHYTRTMEYTGNNKCNTIKVNFNKENGEIIIYNNGTGIEVSKYEDEDFYIPEMIFSHEMSGSNFVDSDDKITGGLNGLGAKLTNVVSEYFIIETLDTINKKTYYQKFDGGNLITNKPIIKKTTKKAGFTQITFKLDYNLFYPETGYTLELSEILDKIIKTRTYYISVFCKNTNVFYNDNKIKITKLEQMAKLLIPDKTNLITTELISDKYNWDIVIGIKKSNDIFDQISIVNGICTKSGGTHIKHIQKLIKDNLKTKLEKLMKGKTNINSNIILNNLFIFMTGSVSQVDFKGQNKDELSIHINQFKNYKFDEKIYTKIWSKLKTLLSEIYLNVEQKDLDKTNGSKKKKVKSEKLDDAEYAGTSKSDKCKLFLTEGDSAATYAITGLGNLGKEYFGVFPLKGKLLNVRGQTTDKINNNAEITELKKIIGLKHNHEYKSLNELRYGGIIILTDADVDGAHIKGLIINMIHAFWPELIKLGFICSFATPIIKMIKNKNQMLFYTLSEYEEWCKTNSTTGWNTNYYKGLGTSEDVDIKENFKDFHNKLITYTSDANIDKSINLGFNKTLADDRKEWLLNYDKDNIIKQVEKQVKVSDVIYKELSHFSYYDIHRSIPSLIDGLKPTQRKIIFTALNHIKDNSVKQKVAQFSARCAEKTDYHHGEASMTGTIINMAQNYTGSNNSNLLLPKGQFGSRLHNGSDAASERYIFTNVSEITYKLIRKEDSKLLNYIESEGMMIEPEFYMPVLPMILINGSIGIGTGFSTTILPHKLEDVANYIMKKLKNKKINKFKPWYRSFNGTIKEVSKLKYNIIGNYDFYDDKNMINITELPIGTSTKNYKIFLDSLLYDKTVSIKKDIKLQCLTDYKDKGKKEIISFELYLKQDTYNEIKKLKEELFLKKFKLVSSVSETNMYLFNKDNKITKYKSIYEILDYFYEIRLEYYGKRKELLIKDLELDLLVLENKVKFIKNIIENIIKIMNTKKDKLYLQLEQMEFYKYKDNYDYLINMAISTLTYERVIKLENEYKNKQTELNKLRLTDIKDMWINDINEVVIENNIYNKELLKEKNN